MYQDIRSKIHFGYAYHPTPCYKIVILLLQLLQTCRLRYKQLRKVLLSDQDVSDHVSAHYVLAHGGLEIAALNSCLNLKTAFVKE